MRVCLTGLIVFACAPTRPRAGARTIIIDVPIAGVTHDMHRRPEDCEPCLREQRTGETLASCAMSNERVGMGAHWDTMMCSFEVP
jgi:hypothetical protein